MDEFDATLRQRLTVVEASIDVPSRGAKVRRLALRRPLAAAVGLVLAGLVTGSVGATVLDAVIGSPGVFSRDGALACSNVRELAPPHAAAALSALGYDVLWQIEDRDAGTSRISPDAPDVGYIQEGVLDGNDLLLVVELGAAATPVSGSC